MNKFDVFFTDQVEGFLDELDPKAKRKLLFNISKAQKTLNPKLFKKVDPVFWEFRTEYNSMQYRVLAFWDKQRIRPALVVTTHGFIKKTEKLPLQELDRAYAIREKYLRENEKGHR